MLSCKLKFPFELLFSYAVLAEVLHQAKELGDVRVVGLDLGEGVWEVGAEGAAEYHLLGGHPV